MCIPEAQALGEPLCCYLMEIVCDPKHSFLGSSAGAFLGAAAHAPSDGASGSRVSQSSDSSPLLKRTKSQSGNGGIAGVGVGVGKHGTPSRERHPSRSHGPPPAPSASASAPHSRGSRPASAVRTQTHDLSDSPHASPVFGVLCAYAFFLFSFL